MKTFYSGQWRGSEDKLPVYNPFNNEKVGDVAKITKENLLQALEYLKKERKKVSAFSRSNILYEISEKIKENKVELSESITAESGIPVKGSRHEVARSCQAVRCAAEEAKRIGGETLPTDIIDDTIDKICLTIHQPVGIVSAITPFNHPLNQVIHKVAPAIAAGNSIIIKPSEKTPITALMLCKIILNSGWPKENIAMVLGDIGDIANTLASHDAIDMVSFTGSVEIGEEIHNNSGVKKVALELGGNSVFIVMDDADVDEAARLAVLGAFSNNGQRCTSIKRILLHNKIAAPFVEKLSELTSKLVVGDPFDENTDIGPVIDNNAALYIENVINEAVKDGAKLVLGGKRENNFIYPTILDNVKPESQIVFKETFGPVAPIIRINSLQEAIDQANSTIYGLSDAIFTNNIHHALTAAKEIKTGTVVINEIPGFRIESIPFGGVKKSGLGREGIKHAIKEMSNLKTIIL